MDSINLLGICGSPRKNGNSHFLLEIAPLSQETLDEISRSGLTKEIGRVHL